MHCPLCIDTDLDPTFRSGIEIDRCPRCKGIWLDRGELDKLVDDAPPRGVADRHDDEREHSEEYTTAKKRKKKKKKKSKGQKLADLLDDVLDF